jgi:phage shock protein PspC (stress-responsive transcriptional regulator)
MPHGTPGAAPGAGPTSGPSGPSGPFGPFGAFAANFGPAFKARYGLVRPVTGRHFAGVCAAVGRATNTDPVLWRVLFAVLTLFGGVGLLAYLIGWLLIPADGDTASPIEAVLGRGRSRTSAPIAVIGAVAAILVFALVASEGLRPAVVGALVVLGAAILLSRGTLQRPNQQPTQPEHQPAPPFQPEPVMPPPYQSAADLGTPFTAESVTVPAPAEPMETVSLDKEPNGDSGPAPAYAVSEDEVAVGRPDGVASETPTAPAPSPRPQPTQPPYGQPFAPHGPFVSPPGPYPPSFGPIGPQTPTRRLPLYGPYPPIPGAGLPLPVSSDPMLQYPGMPYSGPPMSAPPKEKVKRPRSRLGRATLSATAIALGTLALVHLVGPDIDPSAYFAVALTIVGLGLVVGAWLGRARLLIPLGLVLSFGMLAATASEHTAPFSDPRRAPEVFMPLSVQELTANNPRHYDNGSVQIDLSQLDFEGQDVTFEAQNEIGEMTVILPPNVDVVVKAKVEIGDANVFHASWGGLSDEWRTVIDNGEDGEGKGGKLTLTLSVDVGNLEVSR